VLSTGASGMHACSTHVTVAQQCLPPAAAQRSWLPMHHIQLYKEAAIDKCNRLQNLHQQPAPFAPAHLQALEAPHVACLYGPLQRAREELPVFEGVQLQEGQLAVQVAHLVLCRGEGQAGRQAGLSGPYSEAGRVVRPLKSVALQRDVAQAEQLLQCGLVACIRCVEEGA
jgi:hypothetical protein